MNIAYLSLDAHARHCVLGFMNSEGVYIDEQRFRTAESELIRNVVRIKARRKLLTVEEGPLAFWIARTLHDYVEEIFVCDPRENHLISRSTQKNDGRDTYNLCRLLRLGELKRVYHPREDHRAIFKASVQTYFNTRNAQVALKQQIKAKYRSWGVFDVEGTQVYHPYHRQVYLGALSHTEIQEQFEVLYAQLDAMTEAKKKAKLLMFRDGEHYKEIKEFRKMPGVGPIGAHVFDAYVQTPHRFRHKQQLWRYSCLGVVDRTSDGKRIGRRRLDRSGNSALKAMSYRTWLGSMRMREPNEVRQYYEASLHRTYNKTHARLNTQRKILTSLWTLWKRNLEYNTESFLGSCLTQV